VSEAPAGWREPSDRRGGDPPVRGDLLTATSGGFGQETRVIGSEHNTQSPDRSQQRGLGQEAEPNLVLHGLRECRRHKRDHFESRTVSYQGAR